VIVVLGAGAAGLIAAIHAADGSEEVLVLERTADGGRKILISGGGRCNVLPAELDPGLFVSDSSPNTLRRLLRAWPLPEQRAFFETTLGIPLILEPETNKLFPRSNRAREVRDKLVAEARRRGATIRFRTFVVDVAPAPEGGWLVVLDSGESITARAVVFGTGGQSVPTTGSDGTGLEIARRLGHQINPTYPALTPLVAEPAIHGDLAGISLVATVSGPDGERRRSTRGGFLFTHRGYSGPAVLDLSHLAVRARIAREPAPIRVQWGDSSPREWEAKLQAGGSATVLSILREALPHRLAARLLDEAGVPVTRELAQLKREERRDLSRLLTEYPLPWTGDEGYRKAEVTGGGVALGEVDPGTQESRRHRGLC
jgi:predicted Rossmann fold flavoprotein